MAKVARVEDGGYHVFFLMDDNTIKVHGGKGGSNHGQLGTGDKAEVLTPTLIPDTADIKQISTYEYSTFFLMKDGTVRVCGHDNDALGELGIGNKGGLVLNPTLIPSLAGVKQISAGGRHTLFLMEDGTVKGCGWNSYNQLGIIRSGGTTLTEVLTPTLIADLAGVKQILAGDQYTFFLMEDGTVKECGAKSAGGLGGGNRLLNPTLIPNLTGVKQISRYCFLMEDGTVNVIGVNVNGQLGTGDKIVRGAPTLIPNLTGVKQISSTNSSTFFLMEDGTVKVCGDNTGYQLGTGDNVEVLIPTPVPNLTGVKQISSAIGGGVYYLMEDGTVKTCGQGSSWLFSGLMKTTPTLIPDLCTVDTFYLYLQGAKAYAEQNGSLAKIADDYTVLTDTEKKSLFESANSELAPVGQLNTLNKFKILRCSTESKDLTCNITAVPKVTRIEPSTLLTINNAGISKVALESQGICKVYVTTDLATYKSFDFVARTWSASQGIDATELQNIKLEEWDALLQGGKQIAFAYELDLLATQDISSIANLTITTYLSNEWAMAMPGTDYKYSYPKGDILRVSLLTNGDYKINYQA